MCEKCLENVDEARAQIRQMLQKAMAEMSNEEFSASDLRDALKYAYENPQDIQYTDEERAALADLIERMDAVEGDELAAMQDEAQAFLSGLSMKSKDIMVHKVHRLAEATQDTIETDQAAFPDEDMGDRLYRALQHLYWWHEPRPDFYPMIFGEDLCADVMQRMNIYARQAMKKLPHFDTVLLVLHDQGAAEALATMMYTSMMEGLAAGYYAGSQGQDCYLWQTHQWGPQGNDEDESDEEAHERLHRTIDLIQDSKES